MKTTAKDRAKAKRARWPIYGEWLRAVVLDTGEERLGWFAQHPVDRRLLRERGWRRGVECRAEFKQSRNSAFHNLAHALGHLLADNVEDFRDLSSHYVLKRMQLESGVACEVIEMDASPVVAAILDACEAMLGAGARKVLGGVLPDIRTIPVKVARSLAFDEMDEDEFRAFFDGIVAYAAEHYGHVMLDEIRAEFWNMANGK